MKQNRIIIDSRGDSTRNSTTPDRSATTRPGLVTTRHPGGDCLIDAPIRHHVDDRTLYAPTSLNTNKKGGSRENRPWYNRI